MFSTAMGITFSRVLSEVPPLPTLQLASALMELFTQEEALRSRQNASASAAAGIVDNMESNICTHIAPGFRALGEEEAGVHSWLRFGGMQLQQIRMMGARPPQTPKLGPPPQGKRMSIPKAQRRMRMYDLDEALIMYKKFRDIVKLRDLLEISQGHVLNVHSLGKIGGKFALDKYHGLTKYPDAYPGVVKLTTDADGWQWLEFTDEAEDLSAEKGRYMREVHEGQIVTWIRKLLMMSQTRTLPLNRFLNLRNVLFLPPDFKSRLIHAYPQFFRVKSVNDTFIVELVEWDESLAVTYREKRLKDNSLELDELMGETNPYVFPMSFPRGFHLRKGVTNFYETFQKLPFQSPYEICRTSPGTMEAEKRNLGVVHEVLSMFVEKRAQIPQLSMFRRDFRLVQSLRNLIERYQGVFYTSYKEDLFTVFLKEAYSGMRLIDRSPLLEYRDRFIKLCLINSEENRLRKGPEDIQRRLREMSHHKSTLGRMDCEGKISCKGAKTEMERSLLNGHDVDILGEDRNWLWMRPKERFRQLMQETGGKHSITELEHNLHKFKGAPQLWPSSDDERNEERGSGEGEILDDDSDFEW